MDNPLAAAAEITARGRPRRSMWPGVALPRFTGGWVGYAGYDAVRYLEPEKLPFETAPRDDRGLPDLHFGLYRQVAIFDHASKILYAINHVRPREHASVEAAHAAGSAELDELRCPPADATACRCPPGDIDLDVAARPARRSTRNLTREAFEAAVRRAKDTSPPATSFQIVPSQRFERRHAGRSVRGLPGPAHRQSRART